MCVCVGVFVCERERERARGTCDVVAARLPPLRLRERESERARERESERARERGEGGERGKRAHNASYPL